MTDAEVAYVRGIEAEMARLRVDLENQEKRLRQLRAAGIDLIAAMDDMHARGETFTDRVSVTSAAMRRAVETKP